MDYRMQGDLPSRGTGPESIIADNLSANTRAFSAALEKRLAFLSDGAREMAARLSERSEGDLFLHSADESVRSLYLSLRDTLLGEAPAVAPCNEAVSLFTRFSATLFDSCYLCRQTLAFTGRAYDGKQAVSLLFGDCPDTPLKDKKIAFVRNLSSGRAFENFARYVFGAMTAYYDSYALACEAIAGGECAYGILPLRGSVDGRLGTFYRMIEKYELGVLLCTDVESQSGDRMRYALVSAGQGVLEANGKMKYECRITLEDPADIGTLTYCAKTFGVAVDHVDFIPGGRTDEGGTFGLRFSFDCREKVLPFLFFLQMEFPQILPVAFYTQIEGAGENR